MSLGHSLISDLHLYRNAMARLRPHLSTMRCGRVDQSVKPAAQKDSDVAGAYVIGGCPLEKCASRVWKVRGSDDCMIDQPSVKIVLGEEGKRQVRGCCELARTGTPSPNFLYARAGR